MNQFIETIFSMLGSAMILAALAVVLTVGSVWIYHRKRGTKANWKRLILVILLVGYLAVVAYATLLRGNGGFTRWNLHLFMGWREAWNHFSVRNWGNILLNILLFVPLGVLVPLVFPKCRGLRMVVVAVGSTLLVECMQLVTGFSVFDVDDLFTNALGALMGYCLLMTVLSAAKKNWGAGFAFFLLAMVPVAAVGGIFAAYQLQPYGNLPEDYVYRTNTRDVTWTLECQLPEDPQTAAVYKAPSKTKAECDAYAASVWDGGYDDIYYYDDDIYYRDYDTKGRMFYLTVSKRDGSYDLWTHLNDDDSEEELVCADMERTELEAVLARYGVTIPAEAEFLGLTEHRLIYRAETVRTENGLLNGECSIEVNEDGTYLNLYNELVVYTHCAEASVLSPETAYRRMQEGYFTGWWFEKRQPEQVTVTACKLDYALDTKGFYQPVYRFEVTTPGWEYGANLIIPAIAN